MLNNIKRLGLLVVIGSMIVGCSAEDIANTISETAEEGRIEANASADNIPVESDENLVEEMCEQLKPMAIAEAQTYEPVEAWEKETMANIYKESGWIIDLFEYLVQNYPEATKEQRLEAVEYAKEVFVENFPTMEEE